MYRARYSFVRRRAWSFSASSITAAIALLAKGDPFARAWLLRAKAEGPIIGYVLLTLGFSIEYGGRDAFIDELYVMSDARSQGIGAAALEFVTGEAR